MTANLTFNACSGASDNQQIYYGKTSTVTGTPLAGGTGWTLYNGAPIAGSVTSISVTGLSDNVPYSFYRYCHCPITGSTNPEIISNIVKYVCPAVISVTPGSTTINYILKVPPSANTPGTLISKVKVTLGDASSTTIYGTNYHDSPFSTFFTTGGFSGLTPNFGYKISFDYIDATGTVIRSCGTQNVTTQVTCDNPVLTIDNVTSTGFNVNYSSVTDLPGDTYNIVINGTTVASGLAETSSPYIATGLSPNTSYTVQVIRNCGYGGTTSTTTTQTTNLVTISGAITLNCSDGGCTHQGSISLNLTFTSPTPSPLTLYFGQVWHNTLTSQFVGSGYDIFTLPVGVITDGYYTAPNLPFRVNVGSGVSSVTIPVDIYQTIPQTGAPWICHSCQSPKTDIYVKVQAPAGYAANFSITNLGVTIHNV